MVAGFLGLGAGSIVLGRALRSREGTGLIPTMMTVAGVGTIGAGLARCSDRSCPSRFLGDADADVGDELHVLFSAVTFGLWIAMPLTAAVRSRGRDRASLVLGAVAFAGWAVTGTLASRDAPKWGGLAQRATIAAALSWFPVAAASLGVQQRRDILTAHAPAR
jgi:hypothetical protein